MRTKKVVLDYSGLNDDELHTLVGKVADCLQDHASFTEPPVTVETLEAQLADYRSKWQKASRGGSVLDFAEKNDARDLLHASLKDIAFYVNKKSSGSRSMLLSSGLIMEADPKPTSGPGQIKDAFLADGPQKNQLLIGFSPQKAALFYEYEIADSVDENGQPIWQPSLQTSKSKGNIFAPTSPGVTYYLRVRGRNKKGVGDWSETASLMAR